ncbi:MAG TPA: hypothetical protein VLA88_04685 [Candidatus Saccharimonadales bacterium]|nr:hypothetical protein [Candidatus Saccharimonadales bacterium]
MGGNGEGNTDSGNSTKGWPEVEFISPTIITGVMWVSLIRFAKPVGVEESKRLYAALADIATDNTSISIRIGSPYAAVTTKEENSGIRSQLTELLKPRITLTGKGCVEASAATYEVTFTLDDWDGTDASARAELTKQLQRGENVLDVTIEDETDIIVTIRGKLTMKMTELEDHLTKILGVRLRLHQHDGSFSGFSAAYMVL